MKKDIHPKWYPDAQVMCSCGATFAVGVALFTRLGEPRGLAAIGMLLLMTATGVLEGTIVGLLQWRRRHRRRL